tara:strand:+ start:22270 stop:25266 length:2997 start_codon:yes stop_codon:yes gene_type:complete
MKQKNLLKIAFCLFLFSNVSYGQILTETFDNDSKFVKGESFFSDGSGDYFGIYDSAGDTDNFGAGSEPSSIPAFTGNTGNFLVGEDMDGDGFLATQTLTWQNLDITGYTDLTFSVKLGANSGFDATTDQITLAVNIDNGGYVDITKFVNPSGFNAFPTDGTTTLGLALQTISGNISGTGSSMDLRLTVASTSGGEEFAVDDLVINGTAASSDPTVGFGVQIPSQNETDATFTSANIPITLTNYDSDDIKIDIDVTGGTAEPGDYTFTSPTQLTFSANGTQNITININDDADTDDETIILTITKTSPSAFTDFVISQDTYTITIIDDETPPVPSLIISEVADPNSDPNNSRFIEIYNNGDSAIDLASEQIYFARQSNGGTISSLALTGTINSNQVMTIGRSGNLSVYGFSANIESGLLTGNGNDGYFLYFGGDETTGTLLDAYGVVGVDGSAEDWEYEDSRAIRINPSSVSPNATWTTSEWTISSATIGDVTPGALENEFRYDGDWKPRDVSNATSSDNVLITSALTLSTNLEINNFEVDNSAIVTISSGVTLIVNGTSTGNVTYNRTLTANQWYLIASPVNGQGIANFYTNEPNTRLGSGVGIAQNVAIATYDNSQVDANDVWAYYTFGQVDGLNDDDTNNTFANGTGYSVSLSVSENVSFTGTVPTSNQSFVLAYGGANNFNLVGNAFTSFFTLGDFYGADSNNSLIGTDFYFWNGSQYITRTSGGNASFEIAPGQGFFVEAISAGTISFNTADLITGNGDTFNKSMDSKLEITLNVFEGKNKRFANIIYTDKATSGYDKGYDGKLFGGVPHSFAIYSDLVESDGKKYQVQSLPNSDYENMVVPIGIIAEADKEITFSAEALNLPSDLKVFLEDRLTNTFTRLDEVNNEYTITLTEKSDGVGRFYLHTKSSSVLSTSETLLESVRIYKTNAATLRIAGLSQGKANVKLFTMLGKQVVNTSFTSNGTKDITLPNLATGIYIVALETESGKLNKKITLE